MIRDDEKEFVGLRRPSERTRRTMFVRPPTEKRSRDLPSGEAVRAWHRAEKIRRLTARRSWGEWNWKINRQHSASGWRVPRARPCNGNEKKEANCDQVAQSAAGWLKKYAVGTRRGARPPALGFGLWPPRHRASGYSQRDAKCQTASGLLPKKNKFAVKSSRRASPPALGSRPRHSFSRVGAQPTRRHGELYDEFLLEP